MKLFNNVHLITNIKLKINNINTIYLINKILIVNNYLKLFLNIVSSYCFSTSYSSKPSPYIFACSYNWTIEINFKNFYVLLFKL